MELLRFCDLFPKYRSASCITIGESMKRAKRFGNAIKALAISASDQTDRSERNGPAITEAMYSSLYAFNRFAPAK